MRSQHSPQRPALTFANQPIEDAPGAPLEQRPSHTGNSVKKNSKARKKKKKNLRACYGFRVKETRISTLLYQLNQYLWIEHTQVLQQVESLTAKSSVAPLKIISPFFSFSLRLSQLSFQLFCSLFLSLGKGEPSCYFFYFNLCFNCSFYPCGP